MTDNVLAFGGHAAGVEADAAAVRKAQFLDYVALRYDDYVRGEACVPDGIVFALGGITQMVQTSWVIEGDSESFERVLLIFVSECLRRDLTGGAC